MPPKRKTPSSSISESPTKRTARSTAAAVASQSTEATGRELRSSRSSAKVPPASAEPYPAKATVIINTYGHNSYARKLNLSACSLKENEEHAVSNMRKSSDDELNTLPPTKPMKRTSKLLLTALPPNSVPSTPTRSRRGRTQANTSTPVRRQPKRGQAQSLSLTPSTEHAYADQKEGPPEDVMIRTTRSRSIPTTVSIPTLSSQKAPPTVAKKNDKAGEESTRRRNTSLNLSVEATASNRVSSQKRPKSRDQDDSDEPPKKQRAVVVSKNTTTISRASSSGPLSSTDSQRSTSPTPLKFDSVVLPPAPQINQSTVSAVAEGRDMRTNSASPSVSPVPVRPLPSSSKKFLFQSSPTRLPSALPDHLHGCFHAQKRAIMCALQHPPDVFGTETDTVDDPATNKVAAQQLSSLLSGTITRGEGNSCIVLGPRGSGKSRLVKQCISEFSADDPVVLRLSGWTQHSDRLALREIAYQLSQQTGTSYSAHIDKSFEDGDTGGEGGSEEVNPFLESQAPSTVSLPPSLHLPALISILPALNRPTIIILEGFDLFTLHPRQALLYCLLDTAQSCRATVGSKGIAIIGITNRVDPIELEKRVKSRFSGRMIRTAPPRTIHAWEKIAKTILSSGIDSIVENQLEQDATVAEWCGLWAVTIDQFLGDPMVQAVCTETFSITRNIGMLSKLLLPAVLRMSPASPSLSPTHFVDATNSQRIRPHFPFLHTLSYPAICLLIASVHANTAGHSTFTFEMLHEHFRDQLRASTSAPVQVNGGSIGMVRCGRQVLITAFEDLVGTRIFAPTTAYTLSIAKEFVRYRSVVDTQDVRKAVDRVNQVNLKKWLTKAQ